MNDIANKLLLTGDNFIPEMHLRQPEFTYSACGPFPKSKERMQRYICQKELDKACFQHYMAHGDFKDLPNDKAFYMLKI